MPSIADLANAESIRLGSTALSPLATLGAGQLSLAEAMFKQREQEKRDNERQQNALELQRNSLEMQDKLANARIEAQNSRQDSKDQAQRERDEEKAKQQDKIQTQKANDAAGAAAAKDKALRITNAQKAYKGYGVTLRSSDFDENGDIKSDAEDAANLQIAKAHKAEQDKADKLGQVPDQIRAAAETTLGKLPSGVTNSQVERPLGTKAMNEVSKDTEQVHFCIGTDGISMYDEVDIPVMSILDSALGGSMSSRLFQEVRERRGLVYSIGSYTFKVRRIQS